MQHFFTHENGCSSDVHVAYPYEGHLCIKNGLLVVEDCSPYLEVHHYAPGALCSRLDGVQEGSLVVISPKGYGTCVHDNDGFCPVIEYWRYFFNIGEIAFGDMARKIKELDANLCVYLVAKPGTDAVGYRLERVPLEYLSLSGLGDQTDDYDLVDVALEDPTLGCIGFMGRADLDLVSAWTSTPSRALKLLRIIIWNVIAEKATRDQASEALERLSGGEPAAMRVLATQENGKSIQEAVQSVVSSAYPFLEIVRMQALPGAPYSRAVAIEVLYYVEKTLPGRVEMAHSVVDLQAIVSNRCDNVIWGIVKFPDSDSGITKAIADRFQREQEFRDDVCTVLVSLKYSVLVADGKERLVKESMELCQKHQLEGAIPVLALLSFGGWNWNSQDEFYQQLKSCQSIEAVFQWITSCVASSGNHECSRQCYWRAYCEGKPSLAPHFADLVSHALSSTRVFERPYCQCIKCVNWGMSKDVLFCCIREALSRPMGLSCDFRRILVHLSYNKDSAVQVSLRTCIDSMRPGWHSQYTLDDAVVEFVYRNGPSLVRRALTARVHEMKLVDRTISALPNRDVLIEVVKGVPEEARLRPLFASYFSANGIGAAEVALRWTVENSDYTVLSCSVVRGAMCVLEDGIVAMSGCAFRDPNTADRLIQYTGPRVVGQLSNIINAQHSHISVQVDRQRNLARVCRVVGSEECGELWERGLILRWSPERGVSLFQFGSGKSRAVCFSIDKAVPELLCVFECNPDRD